MERENKQSSSPSSFAVDLFGPKDSTSKSPNSSTGFFGSILGPETSMVHAPQGYGNAPQETYADYKKGKENPCPTKKEMNSSYDHNGRSVDPCYYNSSIYYGGQESYSPSTRNSPPKHFENDGEDVDQNESNSSGGASRGNWWKGSLYY